MADDRRRNEPSLHADVARSQTPVDILEVQKERFVERTDLIERRRREKQRATRRPLDRTRRLLGVPRHSETEMMVSHARRLEITASRPDLVWRIGIHDQRRQDAAAMLTICFDEPVERVDS